MPYMETPGELAEELADLVGVYGGHEEDERVACRICWVTEMEQRIIASVRNAETLRYTRADEVAGGGGNV